MHATKLNVLCIICLRRNILLLHWNEEQICVTVVWDNTHSWHRLATILKRHKKFIFEHFFPSTSFINASSCFTYISIYSFSVTLEWLTKLNKMFRGTKINSVRKVRIFWNNPSLYWAVLFCLSLLTRLSCLCFLLKLYCLLFYSFFFPMLGLALAYLINAPWC